MNFSYWERECFIRRPDFAIVGSGIVGLSTSIYLKQKFPRAEIVIFERGMLPSGASTRNAGFACFGSISELLDDRSQLSEEEMVRLVAKRWNGLQNLRELLGDHQAGLKITGGTELFTSEQQELFERCKAQIENFNKLLRNEVGESVFAQVSIDKFPFRNFKNAIYNPYEGQLHTGRMMSSLLKMSQSMGVKIFNGANLERYQENNGRVQLEVSGRQINVGQLLITTNGFAKKLIDNIDVKPVRNQVLITKPIETLNWEGVFHLERGYFYFRNVGKRILIGGGRHLFEEQEATDEFALTENVQQKLEEILRSYVLPEHQQFEIDMRWSGILGVGSSREVIVKQISPRVICGVRLGGMGIAIGSLIGKELADRF